MNDDILGIILLIIIILLGIIGAVAVILLMSIVIISSLSPLLNKNNQASKIILNYVEGLNSLEAENIFNKNLEIFNIQYSSATDYKYKDLCNNEIQRFFNRFDSVTYKEVIYSKNFTLEYDEFSDIDYIRIGSSYGTPCGILLNLNDEIDPEHGPFIIDDIYKDFIIQILCDKYLKINDIKKLPELLLLEKH